MKTYLTNCILTFSGAPKGESQAFLDLRVPLEAGEDIVRAFFEGILDTLYPSQLKPGFTPNRVAANKRKVTLVKVSMCADHEGKPEVMDANPALKWFNEGNGKLYFPA